MKKAIVIVVVHILWGIGVAIGYIKWNVIEMARMFKEVVHEICYE